MATTQTHIDIPATRIMGAAGSGKTQRLIQEVRTLLSDGTPVQDIVVFCATPTACRAFRKRLATRDAASEKSDVTPDAEKVTVTTIREYALHILTDDAAQRFTKRKARLLCSFEENFIMEDIKVCGARPKRIREMLKFFYRSWTELADDDPKWLITGEERTIHTMLKDALNDMQAILEPELANLTVNYLRTDDAARQRYGKPHVFVDDYLFLNRASQILSGMLATQSITIAGDTYAGITVFESYPYTEGFDEFAEMHPEATVIRLSDCYRCKSSKHAASVLRGNGPTHSPEQAPHTKTDTDTYPTILEAKTPEDEFMRVAEFVDSALQASKVSECVIVATPNDTWTRNMVVALEKRNLCPESMFVAVPLRGDIRKLDRCLPARVFTALSLIADPQDPLAWRCWCGFGDHLTQSNAFNALRTTTEETHTNFYDALYTLACAPNDTPYEELAHQAGMQGIIEAFRFGRTIIQTATEKTGSALLDTLTQLVTNNANESVPSSIINLCVDTNGDIAQSDDAVTLLARARQKLTAPYLKLDSSVAVMPYDRLVGLSPDVLVVSGFVNGFIPCRNYFDGAVMPLDKQEQTHDLDTRRMYTLLSKANRVLAISGFVSVDLETAERLDLKIKRIRLEDNKRMCTLEPSEFLELAFGKSLDVS